MIFSWTNRTATVAAVHMLNARRVRRILIHRPASGREAGEIFLPGAISPKGQPVSVPSPADARRARAPEDGLLQETGIIKSRRWPSARRT